jgi:dihydrofolate reductase
MRKVILLMHVSLDGFVAGPNGEMDWIVYDHDVEHDAHALHASTDAAIYGRVTYQMMESYWPTVLADPSSTGPALNHARWLDGATKIVISRTLEAVTWKNTLLIKDHVAEEIAKLKQQPGKDMWLIGSPSIVHEFMRHDLIDEYRLNVNPVVLGRGIPLFASADQPLQLKLQEAKPYACGVVGLRYEPADQAR